MERKGEQRRQTGFEEPTTQPPTFREWLVAVLLFPVTVKRLAEGMNRLADEMTHYRQIPQHLADLDEVGRDFNTGFYRLLGGKATYKRPAPDPDSKYVFPPSRR